MRSELLAFQSPILIRNVLYKTNTCEMQGGIVNIFLKNKYYSLIATNNYIDLAC